MTMTRPLITIELSKQALSDLLDGLEVGIDNMNPKSYRYKAIEDMYRLIKKANSQGLTKVKILYKKEILSDKANK